MFGKKRRAAAAAQRQRRAQGHIPRIAQYRDRVLDEDRERERKRREEEARQEAARRQTQPDPGFRFSRKASTDPEPDRYDEGAVRSLMRAPISPDALRRALERSKNRSFADQVAVLIRQKQLRDSAVYKAAGVDRRLFSKIMSDDDYRPSRDTAIALAFGLRLTLPEARDLLSRVGYALSHSDPRDVAIEYFFAEGCHDLIEINLTLDALGFKPVGR